MLQGSILYAGRPSAFSDYFYIATLQIWIDNTEMVSQKESRHLLYSAEGNVMYCHVGLLYTSQNTESAVHMCSTEHLFWKLNKIIWKKLVLEYYFSKIKGLHFLLGPHHGVFSCFTKNSEKLFLYKVDGYFWIYRQFALFLHHPGPNRCGARCGEGMTDPGNYFLCCRSLMVM